MSFCVRPTYKSRMIATLAPDAFIIEDNITDQEELEEIINTIKNFSQRSSHEKIITAAEMQDVISKSSINPDTNPSARKGVEAMLKAKVASETQEKSLLINVVTDHGFSSNSVSKFNNTQQSARIARELEKEIAAIRARRRGIKIEESRNIPDDIAQQISLMKGDMDDDSSLLKTDNGDEKIEISNAVNNEANSTIHKAKQVLSMGFPRTASMVRGYVHRQDGGSSGGSIKRVALGMSDGF